MTAAPAAQCGRCIHWATSGGIVAPRVRRCVALQEGDTPPRALALLEVLAADLAAAGRCPNFDRGTDAPDAYRARDLDE